MAGFLNYRESLCQHFPINLITSSFYSKIQADTGKAALDSLCNIRMMTPVMATKKTPLKPAAKKPAKAAAAPVATRPKVTAAPAFGKTNKLTAPLRERPLSPHLSVYRWQITMALSILHRGTGVFLYLGAFVIAAMLVALSYGERHFDEALVLFRTPAGGVGLFIWVFCLFFHLCNGIRHLFWDAGIGFTLRTARFSGVLTVLTATALTFIVLLGVCPDIARQLGL